jgi:hypothetical protein
MGNLTIPRAVGYATGMVNYFFRGQLSLSLPPDGLMAVVDQGTPHHMAQDDPSLPVQNDDGVTTFGFKTLRVRVKNATMVDANGHPTMIDAGYPALGPIQQTLNGGTGPDGQSNGYLVAIAHYHRNPCYKPDLSGEYVIMRDQDGQPTTPTVPSGCSVADTRTAIPEISVSAKVWIDQDGNLPGPGNSESACANVGNINTGGSGNCQDKSALLEFDFSNDPIPVNATDLTLQVAYRGQIGFETDGIAVGSMDVSEPNYFTQWNNTDWYFDYGVWKNPDQVTDAPPFPAGPETTMAICFASQRVALLNDNQNLPVHEFSRIAFISGYRDAIMSADSTINGQPPNFIVYDGSLPLAKRQADRHNVYPGHGTFDPDPMTYFGRGTTLGYDFSQHFATWGDNTQDQYIKLLALQPALGSNGAPGIPAAVKTQFTSAPDAACQNSPGSAASVAVAKSQQSVAPSLIPSGQGGAKQNGALNATSH